MTAGEGPGLEQLVIMVNAGGLRPGLEQPVIMAKRPRLRPVQDETERVRVAGRTRAQTAQRRATCTSTRGMDRSNAGTDGRTTSQDGRVTPGTHGAPLRTTTLGKRRENHRDRSADLDSS